MSSATATAAHLSRPSPHATSTPLPAPSLGAAKATAAGSALFSEVLSSLQSATPRLSASPRGPEAGAGPPPHSTASPSNAPAAPLRPSHRVVPATLCGAPSTSPGRSAAPLGAHIGRPPALRGGASPALRACLTAARTAASHPPGPAARSSARLAKNISAVRPRDQDSSSSAAPGMYANGAPEPPETPVACLRSPRQCSGSEALSSTSGTPPPVPPHESPEGADTQRGSSGRSSSDASSRSPGGSSDRRDCTKRGMSPAMASRSSSETHGGSAGSPEPPCPLQPPPRSSAHAAFTTAAHTGTVFASASGKRFVELLVASTTRAPRPSPAAAAAATCRLSLCVEKDQLCACPSVLLK
mmetsp:Transcript_5743/g.19990  ORF Transcript_5743/g.19990 Transcript_5743/m.19990 type:complete len:356 (+) Transcript_5743:301-1368(+)